MNYKINTLMSIITIFSILTAADIKSDNNKDLGDISAKIKAMYVIHDKDNGYAPNNGSGYLIQLNYKSSDIAIEGLKVGLGAYLNGDITTEWDKDGEKPARGMFVSPKGKESAQFAEVYLSYKYKDKAQLKLGRQILSTPLTAIKWSLMPSFYEAYGINAKLIKGLDLNIIQITRMSYGSRAVADWSLIGEKTGTAGAPNVIEEKNGIEQAHFISFENISGVDSSAGITALGATYSGVQNLKIKMWNYYADSIVNNFYTDATYPLKLNKSLTMNLSAQYLNQQSVNNFINPYTEKDIDFWLIGLKAEIKTKIWNIYLAYNQSTNSDQMYNIYGSDPAYTSSLFSRNQYRQDVKAYKVGGSYKIIKGLKAISSYANYGKSKTVNSVGWTPTTDAYEVNFCLKYKPNKAWSLVLCNSLRSSEYDEFGGADREQEHVRFITSYTF